MKMKLGNCGNAFIRIKALLILLVVMLIATSYSAHAYRSFPNSPQYAKLPGAATVMNYYYNQIDSELSITGSGQQIVHAINQWDIASWYTIFSQGAGGSPTGHTHQIRAVWFGWQQWFNTSCGNTITMGDSKIVAFACTQDVLVLLNSEGDWEWNTNGLQGESGNWSLECLCNRIYQDVLRATLHELGHVWGLAHPFNSTPTNVMNSGIWSQTLYEDDKRGATQFYGPSTSFENNLTLSWFPGYTYTETEGHDNLVSHRKNTTGNLTIQSYEPPIGVLPYSGSRHRKLYGNASGHYSYVYYKVFSADDDEINGDFRYLTVTNGMKLSWYQYSQQQTRMGVDILFTDGTTLRDSALTDQYGICVHPACRHVYGTGVWRRFEVNLTALQGRTIKDIMIAYDNGNEGDTGVFRAYFDNLTISY